MLALALVLEGYKRGEADLVAHSGLRANGSFIQNLVLTDIATGWTECMPLLFREQALLTKVLSQMRERAAHRCSRIQVNELAASAC
jgi:hypothetical protein